MSIAYPLGEQRFWEIDADYAAIAKFRSNRSR
jgi:hypothetical protein